MVKQALSSVEPMAFSVLRFSMAAVLLLALVRWKEGQVTIPRRYWLPMLALGMIGAGNQVLWMYGLNYTTSGKSALLLAASPAFVVTMRAFRGERVGARVALSILIAFIGVAFIVDPTGEGAPGELIGDLLTLGASFMWALYANTGPMMLATFSPLRVTAYVFSVTALVVSIPGLSLALATPWVEMPFSVWWQLGYSCFLAAGLAWVLWYRGVSQLGPVKVILYQYLVPVVALFISVYWMAEGFHWPQGLGAALVLTGTLGARLWLPSPAPETAALQEDQAAPGK